MNAHIAKPLDKKELVKQVYRLINKIEIDKDKNIYIYFNFSKEIAFLFNQPELPFVILSDDGKQEPHLSWFPSYNTKKKESCRRQLFFFFMRIFTIASLQDHPLCSLFLNRNTAGMHGITNVSCYPIRFGSMLSSQNKGKQEKPALRKRRAGFYFRSSQ